MFPLTRPTLNFSPNPRNFIDPLKKNLICSKNIEHIFVFATGQFCMCTEALWIQEIQLLFNSMKILIIVFEFAFCNVFTWIGNTIF
jgi:hypothetical protein